MKSLLIVSMALLGMSATAFGDLMVTLTPSTVVYPPSSDPAQCQLNGTAPCVVFSGTLTDTDTDGSLLYLESAAINFTVPGDASYFTLDNTFFSDVPGVLSGDPNWATDGNPFANTYTGPIFGVDIAPSTPVGTYVETIVISAAGGTDDPLLNGFTVDEAFTVIVTPEPTSGLTMVGGLLVMAALRRARHSHPC
jgi:hypothetical protein